MNKKKASLFLSYLSSHPQATVASAGLGNIGPGDLEFGPDSASKSLYPLSLPFLSGGSL